jgi:catechol 2,3-dioxygenase-like lactoylglutathione lyase family enzyme
MTAGIDEMYAFHMGFVVKDLEATTERYSRLLQVPRWYFRETDVLALPWNPETTDGRIRIAHGRTPGQTLELIQPLEGESFASMFLRDHGEGVQHLGYWVPNLQQGIERAIEAGAKLSHANFRRDGSGYAQLTAGSSTHAILDAVDVDRPAFLDSGLGMLQIELAGPGVLKLQRRSMGVDHPRVVSLPPWPDFESGA